MTESEYLLASDLANLRTAAHALRQLVEVDIVRTVLIEIDAEIQDVQKKIVLT